MLLDEVHFEPSGKQVANQFALPDEGIFVVQGAQLGICNREQDFLVFVFLDGRKSFLNLLWRKSQMMKHLLYLDAPPMIVS